MPRKDPTTPHQPLHKPIPHEKTTRQLSSSSRASKKPHTHTHTSHKTTHPKTQEEDHTHTEQPHLTSLSLNPNKSAFNTHRFLFHTFLITSMSILITILLPTLFAYKSTLYFTYLTTLSRQLAAQGWLVILTSSLALGLTSAWLAERYAERVYARFRIYLISLFTILIISYVLTFITTSLDLFSYVSMNGFAYTWLSMLLLAAAIPISAYLILRIIQDITSITSLGGIGALIASLGCPSCGALLWSLIGISILPLLPLKGIELKIGAFVILILTLRFIEQPRTTRTPTLTPREQRFYTLLILGLSVYALVLLTSTLTLAATLTSLKGPSLGNIDVTSLQSTAQTLRSVFPELDKSKNANEIISILIPRGTPGYSQIFNGISYDEPVTSLDKLARSYPVFKRDVQQDPEAWQRYLTLAAAPRGVSC